MASVWHIMESQHYQRCANRDRHVNQRTKRPSHPKRHHSQRSHAPLAGHDLGPRIELGRRGYPRACGIPANAASRRPANPTSAATDAGRLHGVHLLGREQCGAGVSLRQNIAPADISQPQRPRLGTSGRELLRIWAWLAGYDGGSRRRLVHLRQKQAVTRKLVIRQRSPRARELRQLLEAGSGVEST